MSTTGHDHHPWKTDDNSYGGDEAAGRAGKEILEPSPYGFIHRMASSGKSTSNSRSSSKAKKKAVEDIDMSGKQQTAMDQFLTNPSGMNWEDLVKSMKNKNKKRRRRSSSSRKSSSSKSKGRGRKSLTPVEEMMNEDYHDRSCSTLGLVNNEEGGESIDFVQGGDEEEQPGEDVNIRSYSDEIDFFPTFDFSGFHQHRMASNLPPARAFSDEEAAGEFEKDYVSSSSGRSGYHRKKYAIVCTVLVLLVGIVAGMFVVKGMSNASTSQNLLEERLPEETPFPSWYGSSNSKSSENNDQPEKDEESTKAEGEFDVIALPSESKEDVQKVEASKSNSSAESTDDSKAAVAATSDNNDDSATAATAKTLYIGPAAVATAVKAKPMSTSHGKTLLTIKGSGGTTFVGTGGASNSDEENAEESSNDNKKQHISYLRFHYSNLISSKDTVLQAKLELHLTTHPKHIIKEEDNATTSIDIHIDALPNASEQWVHGDVSWNNPLQRAGAHRVSSYEITKGSLLLDQNQSGMIEVDVTSEVVPGEHSVSLMLSTDSKEKLEFASMDWKNGKLKPRLVIVVAAAAR